MFYIIEYNTDMRSPRPKYHRFATVKKAQKFVDGYEVRHAFPGAIGKDVPRCQQNYHNRIISGIYCMPNNFSLKREAKKLMPTRYEPSSMYPNHYESDAIYKLGVRMEDVS